MLSLCLLSWSVHIIFSYLFKKTFLKLCDSNGFFLLSSEMRLIFVCSLSYKKNDDDKYDNFSKLKLLLMSPYGFLFVLSFLHCIYAREKVSPYHFLLFHSFLLKLIVDFFVFICFIEFHE